jgi:hypothetical protein
VGKVSTLTVSALDNHDLFQSFAILMSRANEMRLC